MSKNTELAKKIKKLADKGIGGENDCKLLIYNSLWLFSFL